MKYSRIIGTGGYLPERILSNHDLEKMVDTSNDWIIERTGIHERHIAAENQGTCDMAENAGRQALEMAGCDPADLDLIIVATTTPDRIFPSTAALLQQRLGNRKAAVFDVQAVCTGFIYALSIADKFIRTDEAKRVLVCGAETFSRLINWKDRNTCVLFGDGAGAVVLGGSEEPGILSTHLYADGHYNQLLTAEGHPNQGVLEGGDAFTTMQGSEVFKFAVNKLAESAANALAKNNISTDELDWMVPHQANLRIIKAVAKKLKVPMDKVVLTVEKHGNTSAASVPLALNVAVRDGRIQKGHKILLEAMGGGFTWGSALAVF